MSNGSLSCCDIDEFVEDEDEFVEDEYIAYILIAGLDEENLILYWSVSINTIFINSARRKADEYVSDKR